MSLGFRDRSPYSSLRKALRFARRLGAECGRRASNVPDTVGALEPILRQRLALLAEGMTERRRGLREQESIAKEKLGKIEPVDPPPFPVLQSPWVLAAELLPFAILEAIMAYPALGAFQEFGDRGVKQVSVAVLVGLLLAAIVFASGYLLAYVIKRPTHRHPSTSRHWLVWWTLTGLAAVVILSLLVLPIFFTAGRADNLRIAAWWAEQAKIEQPDDFSGMPETTAPADAQQPPPDDPDLRWTLVLQLVALMVGLAGATMYFYGEDYRRYASLEEEAEETRERLEALDINERAKAEDEIAAGVFRYYEYFRYRERGGAQTGQKIPPAVIQPPDREFWLKEYYSMTERPDKPPTEPLEGEGRQDIA